MKERRLKDSPLTPVNSEAAVLGSMLLDRECVAGVREVLSDGAGFYLAEHRILYDELLSWDAVAEVWDIVAFRNRLHERRRYDSVGGVDYLMRLVESTPSSATAMYHAEQTRRGHLAREAMAIARHTRRQLYDGCSIAEQLSQASEQFAALAQRCGQSGGESLEAVTAASITPEPLTWFWPNRIPAGMYSFIVGDPGAGKSFLSCYLASIASRGALWADGTWVGEPMDVLMFITEDNLSRTVVPRLNAHCADLSRIHFCQGVSIGKDKRMFNIERNMDLLCRRIDAMDNCGLILFDPVTGFMGDINQNSQSDVRGVLGRICRLAEEKQITVIGLSHLNKKVDLDMRHRSIGSVAFNAVPRAVWGVCASDEAEGNGQEAGVCTRISESLDALGRRLDPHGQTDPANLQSTISNIQSKQRYFFPIKDNLCVQPEALEFTIGDGRVLFGRTLNNAQLNAALKPDKHIPQRLTKKEHAKQLILDLLKSGPTESDKLIEAVIKQGISEKTALYARAELRRAKKVDCENLNGNGYEWFLMEEH